MKVKIEVAVFKMRESGNIFTLNIYGCEDRNDVPYKSNNEAEFIGFQFVEVEI